MAEVEKKNKAEISDSIVSHKQSSLIENLLHDLEKQCQESVLEVILTLNLEESLLFKLQDFLFPKMVIRNSVPQVFAANHNQAFSHAKGQYCCVMNSNIRLKDDPFQALINCLRVPSVGVENPLVVNAGRETEDSARRLPSSLKILFKAFSIKRVSILRAHRIGRSVTITRLFFNLLITIMARKKEAK